MKIHEDQLLFWVFVKSFVTHRHCKWNRIDNQELFWSRI